ncbi:MAG: hypothetical protein R3286_10035 [Gammaproteobacteria bacterium]|nr:hypothetical protein [Gammaproteobacteria bacterium]
MKLFALFAASAVLACLLAAVSIWSHRKVWMKVSALVLVTGFLPTVYLSYADLLSRPKPANLEWWHENADEATVVASRLRENESIFLWLEVQGVGEPRAYVMPWQQELAKQLHGAQREAEANGTEVRMRKPFRFRSEEQEPLFYAEPQPPLPAKHTPAQGQHFFRRPTVRTVAGDA